MARFTREELESFRDEPVEDLLGAGIRLLFVGINPGLWTAATKTHFCHPTNRFYPALRRAGLIDWDLDPTSGLEDWQKAALIDSGIGITNLVNRATIRASELSSAELRSGAKRLVDLSEELHPKVVAVAGVTAFRTAFRRPHADLGKQIELIGAGDLWVVPNPSGLNAHETIDSLADRFRQVASASGVL